MRAPYINEYILSVGEPRGLLRTLGEFSARRDAYGRVRFTAGNNAVVFNVDSPAGAAMLKCYTRPGVPRPEVYDYLGSHPDPLLCGARLLPREMYVYDALGGGAWHDIVAGPWVEGNTLSLEIRRAAREEDTARLRRLAEEFIRFAAELLSREWAHGDLKPDNIIVTPGGSMVLVDCDAMFIPGSEAPPTVEIGTPGFQHPLRDGDTYGKHVDDYPAALIAASLCALAHAPSMYGRWNRSDNILFHPQQIVDGDCPAYDETLRLLARRGDNRACALALLLKSPKPEIPGLRDYFDSFFTAHEEVPAGIFEHGGRWGYADGNGKWLIPPIFDEATG